MLNLNGSGSPRLLVLYGWGNVIGPHNKQFGSWSQFKIEGEIHFSDSYLRTVLATATVFHWFLTHIRQRFLTACQDSKRWPIVKLCG